MDNNIQKISDRKGLATTSLVLGIIGMAILLIPIVKINGSQVIAWNIFGLLAQIVGLILGILGIKSSKRASAIAGIILCIVGLMAFVVLNSFYVKESTKETTTVNKPATENTANTQIANPASVNCIEKGGKLSIVDKPEGQVGMCTFSDGTVCEEWAYFRGECQKK